MTIGPGDDDPELEDDDELDEGDDENLEDEDEDDDECAHGVPFSEDCEDCELEEDAEPG